MEIKIVKNNKNFYDALYSIHCSVMPENDKMTKVCFYDEFERDTRLYLVATNKDEVCGYLGILDTLDDYNVIGIAVKKDYQNKGIATKLINAIKDIAKERNVKTISLEVDEKNKKAINFYKKMGFVLTNIRKKYYKDNNALIMWYYL